MSDPEIIGTEMLYDAGSSFTSLQNAMVFAIQNGFTSTEVQFQNQEAFRSLVASAFGVEPPAEPPAAAYECTSIMGLRVAIREDRPYPMTLVSFRTHAAPANPLP